jgi:hypothetical protein
MRYKKLGIVRKKPGLQSWEFEFNYTLLSGAETEVFVVSGPRPVPAEAITVWECDRCKSHNTLTAIACAVCGAIRQPKVPAPHRR